MIRIFSERLWKNSKAFSIAHVTQALIKRHKALSCCEIWDYKLGGYQVLKKWLSYRESDVLRRMLTPEEVLYFAEMGRRVGGILATA